MGDSPRRRWAVVMASVAFALLLLVTGEVVVRVANVQPQEWPAAGKGKKIFRALQVDPILGSLPAPGWSGQWMTGFNAAFDRRGFRLTGHPPLPSAPVRVAFVGDSCTFGWGLNTPDTFVARLDARQRADRLERFDFMNAAAPGLSAISGLYILRERVLPLRPNVVVLGFSANNAFRFSRVPDAERFRFFALRRALFRSRLFHILAALAANLRPPAVDPHVGKAVYTTPLAQLYRIAPPDEFEAALRAMVIDSRAAGAAVVLLLFPRAVQVASTDRREDAAYVVRNTPAPKASELPAVRERDLLQYSCLDHRRLADPLRTLHQQVHSWQPLYPNDATMIATLRRGAQAYVAGDYPQAIAAFTHALEQQPTSPLARYDRGVAALAAGDRATGWHDLQEADHLACNAFMHYTVILRKVALDLDVPVVDLLLHFQAEDAATLFGDSAHPSAAGARVIADALWPVLLRETGQSEVRSTQ